MYNGIQVYAVYVLCPAVYKNGMYKYDLFRASLGFSVRNAFPPPNAPNPLRHKGTRHRL
jgi:hypothetical protein